MMNISNHSTRNSFDSNIIRIETQSFNINGLDSGSKQILTLNGSSNDTYGDQKYIGRKRYNDVYKCKIEDCHRFLNNLVELDSHVKGHEKIFKCKYGDCDKAYLVHENLHRHTKTHFPIKKIFKCDFPGCMKSFTARYNQKVKFINLRFIIEYM